MKAAERAHEFKVREFLKSADQRQARKDKRKAEQLEEALAVLIPDDAARAAAAHLTAIGFTLVEHVKHFESELL